MFYSCLRQSLLLICHQAAPREPWYRDNLDQAIVLSDADSTHRQIDPPDILKTKYACSYMHLHKLQMYARTY